MGKQKHSLVDKAISAWWGKVILALLIFAGTYAAYSDFTKLENGDVNLIVGSKWFIGLYNLFGKWPTVAVFGLLGAAFLGWGLKQLSTGNE